MLISASARLFRRKGLISAANYDYKKDGCGNHEQRFAYNLLFTQAIAGASTERHQVPSHERIDGAKPTLRNELERLLVDRRVRLHHIGRHPNSNLIKQ